MDTIKLTVDEILAFYDFPQLFIGSCEESKYLCLAYGIDDYLCIKVDDSSLSKFKNREIDLLTLYTNTLEYFIGDWEDSDFRIVCSLVGPVKKSILPEPGFYYERGD
jgi:hypothetical protein